MNEEEIMKGNIKLTVFDMFDFNELTKVVNAIQALGYDAKILERGVVVLQKKK